MATATNEFQFGLRSLLGAITLFAVLLGIVISFGEIIGLGGHMALAMFASQQGVQIPVYLVWIWGATMLWRRRHVHPLTSRSGLIGLFGLTVTSLLATFAMIWFQSTMMMRGGGSAATWIGTFMLLNSFLQSVTKAVFWVFIVKAMLRWRSPAALDAAANHQQ